jgi:hypothetical protein
MRAVAIRAAACAAVASLALAPVAGAQARATLDFEQVPVNAAGFNATPFTELSGFRFENWGVLSSAATFGTGTNASSGTRFLYGFARAGASFVYRDAPERWDLLGASLSFRTLDGDLSPATVTIRGFRDADEVFVRVLTLTTVAQRFELDLRDVTEVAFETGALDATRSAVLAVDDLTVTVPEPSSVVLLATGAGMLLLVRRRRAR